MDTPLAGLFLANQIYLKSFQKSLIGWKNPALFCFFNKAAFVLDM